MISPEQFVTAWKGEPLTCFAPDAVKATKIPEGCKHFLMRAGLPRRVLPQYEFEIEAE